MFEASAQSPGRTILGKPPFRILRGPFRQCPPLPAYVPHSVIPSSARVYRVPLACGAGVPALGSILGEGSLWFEALSFPQRLAFQHQVNLEAGECQQRISDLEESRRIIPSDLLFQPLKNGVPGDEEPGAQGHLAGVGGVGWVPLPWLCSSPPGTGMSCLFSTSVTPSALWFE